MLTQATTKRVHVISKWKNDPKKEEIKNEREREKKENKKMIQEKEHDLSGRADA